MVLTTYGRSSGFCVQACRVQDGACPACGTRLAGVFEATAGTWGRQRRAVRLAGARLQDR